MESSENIWNTFTEYFVYFNDMHMHINLEMNETSIKKIKTKLYRNKVLLFDIHV